MDERMSHDPIDLAVYRARIQREGSLSCRIVSDSMKPLIQVNESVTIEPIADPKFLRRFDIVVYYSRQRMNCHFVWQRLRESRQALITRSLKDPTEEGLPVPYQHLLGRVVGKRIPFLTQVRIVLSSVLSAGRSR